MVVGSHPSDSLFFDYSNSSFSNNYSDSTLNWFSSHETKDKFKFFVPKGNINETTSFLIIQNSIGDTLYYDSFTTADLIYGYGLELIKTDEEVVEHIKERITHNLREDTFIDLGEGEASFASGPEDIEVYEECKSEKRVLYMYTLWIESSTIVGYSSKSNKAIPLFYCC